MTERDYSLGDGGQAFPVPLAPGLDGSLNDGEPGMSLRDWFAGQALAGLLAHTEIPWHLLAPRDAGGGSGGGRGADVGDPVDWRDQEARENAEGAYRMADAMLAERAKP